MTSATAPSFTHIRTVGVLDLYRNDSTGRYHLVRTGEHCGIPQVYSFMPNDMPLGGGIWVGSETDGGIAYVSNGYSRSYLNRVIRQHLAELAGIEV